MAYIFRSQPEEINYLDTARLVREVPTMPIIADMTLHTLNIAESQMDDAFGRNDET